MKIDLEYGRNGLSLDLPDDTQVIRGKHIPGIQDEAAALRSALREPIGSTALKSLVKAGERVVIVHSDITRATPNDRILPVLLAELEEAGIRHEDICLLNALGTHRKQTPAETCSFLGDYVVDRYRCLQHDCYDDQNLVLVGKTSRGNPVRVNRIYMEADIRILTGFIEPHFFAGFSGGPKGVLPSIAGADSVQTNHSFEMIADPHATWGITEGNPIWEEMREAALLTKPTFLLNVALNRERQISGIFAGDLLEAHRVGVEFVRQASMVKVEAPFDIVLTTNSGYPLDQNLYQGGKGISAANQVVCPGGVIMMFCACEDGLPDHGMYAELLRMADSPERMLEILAEPGFSAQDQWQVQTQSRILLDHRIYIYSDGLSNRQIREAMFRPCRDPNRTLKELEARFGPRRRIAVLPEGPQSIPYL
jgi:nickel-dependent lactate racemase